MLLLLPFHINCAELDSLLWDFYCLWARFYIYFVVSFFFPSLHILIVFARCFLLASFSTLNESNKIRNTSSTTIWLIWNTYESRKNKKRRYDDDMIALSVICNHHMHNFSNIHNYHKITTRQQPAAVANSQSHICEMS